MEEDIKRMKACLVYKDYYSILIYITIVIEKYTGKDKEFLLDIMHNVKKANYDKVNELLKN